MGFNYAVFEIAVAALKASGDPKNGNAVAHALSTLKGEAITGAYDFATGPVPHVSQIPELLAQWRLVSGSYQLVVVNNSLLPAVPVAGSLELPDEPCRRWRSPTSRRATARCPCSARSRWPSRRARPSASSARTARARPPCSTC